MKTKVLILALSLGAGIGIAQTSISQIGREVGVPRHLQNREEYDLSVPKLIEHGRRIFTAVWTDQEGGGRPLTGHGRCAFRSVAAAVVSAELQSRFRARCQFVRGLSCTTVWHCGWPR